MKQKTYDSILEVLSRHAFFHSGLVELQTRLPNILNDVSVKTIRSIQAQYYVRRMKRSTGRHYYRRSREKYYQLYNQAKARNEEHVIVRLALKNDISPCLLARIILEEYYWNDVKHDRVRDKPDGTKGSLPPGLITELIRDIARVPNPFLARELYESMVLDNFYGPVIDSIKKCCGQEYELLLSTYCIKAGLQFIDEDQMRREGYDKTPDIKLKVPIMINNRVVNWIESKASFGDPTNHQQYLVDQFLPYQNRFGDGVVIYWFGFVDELADSINPGIQLLDGFPKQSDILRLQDIVKVEIERHKHALDPINLVKGKPIDSDVDSSDPMYNYVDPMFCEDGDDLIPMFSCNVAVFDGGDADNC